MKTKVILLAIILFGFALRAWQVGSVPTILNRDEAALAYNAFLLKQTGTDEWGQKWPVALESFGDYKLIGYPLFLIGSFTLFGYNDVAVKLPSVLAGTVLIWLGYLFVKKIVKFDETLSLLAAFFIAIQPVFFFYSRIAFEANVALSLFIGGIILLFGYRSLLAKVTAIILFFCAVFTYNTPLLLLPFLLPALLYWYGWKNWRTWLLPVVGAMIVLVLGAGSLLSLSKQKSGITIFSDELLWEQSVKYHLQFSGVVQKIVGNRIVFYSGVLLGNYVKSFTPIFLVFRGGPHPWHQLPGFGHVYGTVYVLGWVGILSAVWFFIQQARKKKSLPKMETTLLFLLFISPLPSAVTVDAPHATRSLLFLFLFVIFAIYGIKKIVEKTKKISMKSILVLLLVFISLEGARYFYTYFTQYPAESTDILKGGFDKTIVDVDKKRPPKKAAIIDDGGYQYILTAWYLKMSPSDFFGTIEHHLPDRIGFRYGYRVGRYRFVKAPTDKVGEEKILITWREDGKYWQVEE